MPLEVMRRLTGRSLDDGLRTLGVRVTVLVQRAACECSDACRCCQLPANALALPLDSLVVQLRQNIQIYTYMLHSCFTPALLQRIYMYIYRYTYFNVYVYIYIYIYVQVKGYIR